MGLGIERHRLGARQSLHRFDHRVLVRAVLVNHGNSAFAIGVEDHPGFGVEGCRVDVIADGQRGDDLAGVGIHYGHDFAAAAQEQTAIVAIDGHAAGGCARCGGPALLNFQVAGINFEDEAFVFEVVEDVTFAVGRCELWPTAEIDRTSYLAGGSIDRSSAVAAAVEGEYARRCRVVDDSVRLLAGGNVGDRFQSFQIKNRNVVALPVADETAARFGGKGDPVHARRLRNVPDQGEGIDVQ